MASIQHPSTSTSYYTPKNLGDIINFALELRKNGKSESTANTVIAKLKTLSRLCDLNDPEQVKATLATAKWMNTTKDGLARMHTGYLKRALTCV